jgi:hypothetical protein
MLSLLCRAVKRLMLVKAGHGRAATVERLREISAPMAAPGQVGGWQGLGGGWGARGLCLSPYLMVVMGGGSR